MSQGKIRHLFPGGNTSLGFFSYYSNIITQEEADRIFVIKGGPGVGKSTFMKRMGAEMQSRGYDLEYLHCSSDNNSLDGVKVPDLGVVFLDGTAPHVVDPKHPGAVDEILNFGEFWNEEGIRAHKSDIINTTREIGYIFSRAYKYLKAAYAIYEGSAAIYSDALNKEEVNKFSAKIIDDVLGGVEVGKEGKQRSMFASALTPNGYCNYLDTIMTTGKVYEFRGGLGTHEDLILEKVKAAAIERGLYVEAYYCALNPYKLDHLLIPDLDVAFTTTNEYHTSKVSVFSSVDMQAYMNRAVLANYKDDLNQNLKEFDNIMSIALQTINRAKALHDKLETYYVPNIRFEEIDRCFEKTLARIIK
ncbi:MAG TPA: ATPase [Pseudobacteroides sp.]|uniref:ATPase n=1 Tax=Pseudobacteroides sp. TaxID=1968840 RepID=UPI002F93A89C